MSRTVEIPYEVLRPIIERTSCIEFDHINVHEGTSDNPELTEFASEVYRTLHWYASPDCQKNHPSWNPEKALDENRN